MEFEYLGPYKIHGVLGRGGMGTVYRGTHAKSGEEVAVKVIATSIADQSRFRRRFSAEIETLKRLKHPNIVQLIGYGEEQGHLFYSMEYVEGSNLYEELKQNGRIPWEESIQVAIQVAAALKQAHDMGIIHRDLKPANLLLNSQGQAKLTDFGIAKLFGASDMTVAGAVIGTADYMPPEQAEGKTVTTRSDLYSLGSMMYAMVSGRAPFAGKSVPETLYAVRYTDPIPLQSLAPGVPKELCELIHQLLEKDPSRRPPTALVVGNRLKAMLQGLKRLGDNTNPGTSATAANLDVHTSLDLGELGDRFIEPSVGAGTQERPTLAAEDVDGLSVDEGTVIANKSRQPTYRGDVKKRYEIQKDVSQFSQSENTSSDRVSPGQTHFTEVEEEDRIRTVRVVTSSDTESGRDWTQVVSIAGLVGLLIASIALIFYFAQPRTADGLYNQIMAAAESGDESQLIDVTGEMEEFLARFPNDERSEEIHGLQDEVDIARLQRLLLRKSRRASSNSDLSPLEQSMLECLELRDVDPAESKLRFAALLAVFGKREDLPPTQNRIVDLAAVAMRQLTREPTSKSSKAADELEAQIAWAESNLGTDELRKFYEGVVELFAKQVWAKKSVQHCEERIVGLNARANP